MERRAQGPAQIQKSTTMSNKEETMTSEEEAKNNKFSFIVGIFIGLAIIIVLTVLSLFFH